MKRLSARELNRATLQRQWLLERQQCSAADAIRQLIGLQAQVARPPFIGLWSRLVGFQRDELAREIRERRVVKASLMRGTLHLVTTDDYLRLRGTFQPVLSSALDAVLKERSVEVDREALVAEARPFLHAEPRSFAELTAFQAERHPGDDPGALRYTVRTHLPLVQVPIDTAWSFPGQPEVRARRGLARAPRPCVRRARRRGDQALPGGVRSGDAEGHGDVVVPDRSRACL